MLITKLIKHFFICLTLANCHVGAQGWSKADFGGPEINNLYYSIEDDNLAEVKNIISKGWPLEKKAGPEKQTILSYAASTGAVKIVQYLVIKGADVNSRSKNGLTPIMQAFPFSGAPQEYNTRKIKVFMLLLSNPNVDLLLTNNGGMTILQIAEKLHDKELTLLIRKELKKRGYKE